MTTQEIIAEIEKLDPLERARVVTYLRQLNQPPTEGTSAEAEGDVWDVLQKYAGTMPELPEDMSVNHDHYLYGTPKRKP